MDGARNCGGVKGCCPILPLKAQPPFFSSSPTKVDPAVTKRQEPCLVSPSSSTDHLP